MVRYFWPMFAVVSVVAALMLLQRWTTTTPRTSLADTLQSTAATESAPALRIGLIPERDIFEQRRRYRPLAEYLASRMERPVEMITVKSYPIVLEDFESGALDGAFLGSLTAAIALDHLDAQVVANPIIDHDITTYQGVLFTRADSDIETVADLVTRRVAMVRSTSAGSLFAISQFVEAGIWSSIPGRPKIVWVGTHDEVLEQVHAGNVDAGSAKNLRYDAVCAQNPDMKFHELARSREVPNNALVVRQDFPEDVLVEIKGVLLTMHSDPQGQEVLAALGATEFRACDATEFEPVFEMVDQLDAWWEAPFFNGEPPRRPWVSNQTEEAG